MKSLSVNFRSWRYQNHCSVLLNMNEKLLLIILI